MGAYLFAGLLGQAMVGLVFGLPVLFAAGFCAMYLLLVVLNALGALVSGYRQQPGGLLVSRKAMAVISGVFATLACLWLLCNLDGRLT